jgi:hypothetical protein
MDAGAPADADIEADADTDGEADADSDADADTGGDADTEAGADSDAGVDTDAGAETDAQADAATDASSEADADSATDANTAPADGNLDGSAPSDDGAVTQDGATGAVVLYEADFTTGQQGWQATGVWTHGAVFDDVGWSNNLPHAEDSTLISPPIDLGGTGPDPVLELDIRYYGEWTGEFTESARAVATHFRVSYNDGPWEAVESVEREIGVHWGPWRCGSSAASGGGSRCPDGWVRAALPLPRRTGSDSVRLALETYWTPPGVENWYQIVFAVRRVRIDVDPRRLHAYGDGFDATTNVTIPEGTLVSGAAAVTFAVPSGATIKRFSLSATARISSQNIFATARAWVRFPNGERSPNLDWFWERDYQSSDYHLVFAEAPQAGTSAVGDFRIEAEMLSFGDESVGVLPWFAELLIE